MSPFAFVLIVCGGTAIVALVLSMTTRPRLARRIAQVSLWLTLGAVPLAIAIDLIQLGLGADHGYSKASVLGRTISHAMNYGVLALPCAVVAALALRRANAARTRR